jgi:PDZ domain-containing protein
MSDFTETTDGDADANPLLAAPGPALRRPWRWPFLFAILGLVLVVALVLVSRNTNDYAIAPGDAKPVTPFIKVPTGLGHPLEGKILLTDVYLEGPLSGFSWLVDWFNSDDDIQSASSLLGTTPEPQYLAQGFLDMSQSQSDATAAALTSLGDHVSAAETGVLVYGVAGGYPASSVLKVGQVITKVDQTTTPTQCALLHALEGRQPGSTVSLAVEQSTLNNVGTFVDGPIKDETVGLARPASRSSVQACGKAFTPTAILGIDAEQQLAWTFPVKISVHLADIGGPSAGLAMALGIIDKLSGGHLTGNRTIAATGAILDPQGDIGDVGGVPQKTIAVEHAGATVFFVPPQELAAARSKATPQLHVYAVSTLHQALQILEHLGGTTSANHVLAQAAP